MSEDATEEASPVDDPEDPQQGFPVVGIGASAGGLDAVTELLQHLPKKPGMAFVLVQHLDPQHATLLPEILQRATSLSVLLAENGMTIEKDHFYVIPPNHNLGLDAGQFVLSPREKNRSLFMPIDYFLRSLVKERGRLSIGVIMSGGGTDGSLALEDIKAADGLVFVQDEATARHHAMPRSAISTGCVDLVLSPAAIAQELSRLGNGFLTKSKLLSKEQPLEDGELKNIFRIVNKQSKIDFSQYKRTTIKRRILRRMALGGVETVAEYLHVLEERPEEIRALVNDFLIRVTSFFRDPEVFTALESDVFPRLIQGRRAEDPIRIWVAGCSTGEEAYSLAIVLLECLGDMASNTPIKILATDINEDALARARAGIYVENIELDVSPERLRRFFTKSNSNYQISKSIRDLCVFSKHNIASDPPFAHMDLVSCRNLMIYFDPVLQKRVLPYFHYSLNPNGMLLLGTSETVGSFGDLFDVEDKDCRIYAKRETSRRPALDFPLQQTSTKGPTQPSEQELVQTLGDTQREAEQLLLSRYAPPSIILDEHLKILHFRGDLSPFLNPMSGHASLDMLRMVRDSLAIEIRGAVEEVKTSNVQTRRQGLIAGEDGSRSIDLEVVPLRGKASEARNFLVLFVECSSSPAAAAEAPPSTKKTADVDSRAEHLEQELAALREYLQTLLEENESASEELKSANEEILSSNEELQSTNEELQTSKEEMQSTNEELVTVNEELQHRNRELGVLNDDLNNLLSGLKIPIIMVDRELKIRRFTSPAEELFNFIPADVGRPIGHLSPNLKIPDLSGFLRETIHTLKTHETEVQDHLGRWYSLRARPYVTTDNRIDGAALAAVDIDAVKRASILLKQSRDAAEAIVDMAWEPLLVIDQEMKVYRANGAFYRMFGLSSREVEGKKLADMGQGQWNQEALLSALESVLRDDRRVRDMEVVVERHVDKPHTLLVNAHRIFWEGISTQMALVAMADITDRKQELAQAKLLAEEQAARAEAEAANRQKDEFLAMLAHEMRNPLAPIRNTLYILKRRFGNDSIAREALELSDRQIHHLTRLLDDLLDISRITRGKIVLRCELVEVQAAIRQAVETSRSIIESREHTLQLDLSPDPIYLMADPARLEQIFCNLLNNAAKYTEPQGKISISVELEHPFVVFRVKDNGIGISAEMLPRVFDLFSQADNSLARSQGGVGIGLTLVKTLTQLHGGSIEAKSEGEGRGSEFVVRLPALSNDVQADSEQLPIRSVPHAQTHTILIVDDNVDAARTLKMALQLNRHDVDFAPNGAEALQVLATKKPDVVLLDIGLPEMDGYEVARRIRSNPEFQDILLVAITGYGQQEDRLLSAEAGINAHLVKPVSLDELERIFSTHVPHSQN